MRPHDRLLNTRPEVTLVTFLSSAGTRSSHSHAYMQVIPAKMAVSLQQIPSREVQEQTGGL